jgi:hypothetical protein
MASRWVIVNSNIYFLRRGKSLKLDSDIYIYIYLKKSMGNETQNGMMVRCFVVSYVGPAPLTPKAGTGVVLSG